MTTSLGLDPHNLGGNGVSPKSRAAVIGAGISGICAAAHLVKYGLETVIFERSSTSGGVWHYDTRVSEDSSYPSMTPSRGDYQVSFPGQFSYNSPPPEPAKDEAATLQCDDQTSRSLENDRQSVLFSPPGPCYEGLRTNVPTSLTVTSLDQWPPGTEEFVSHREVKSHVQWLSLSHGVTERTLYNTRVESATKSFAGWNLRTLTHLVEHGRSKFVEKSWQFDHIVVATGHYTVPRVPDISGLRVLKDWFPQRITHSKRYRSPQTYKGQNVLLVGAGVSSVDIARELSGIAEKIFQSTRGGSHDLPSILLPKDALRVSEISQFSPHSDPTIPGHKSLTDTEPIPGEFLLKDRTALRDIHHVIICTGYITSFPFLGTYHSDLMEAANADDKVLVTMEGNMVHNLHKDIFYIPDPTLAFVGAPYHNTTFSLFDFQAQVVARVFAGKADLPSETEMKQEYQERVQLKGLGTGFHSLSEVGAEFKYVDDLVRWMNGDAVSHDSELMKGHTEEWKALFKKRKEYLAKVFAGEISL